jgi:hypothetical protein
MTVRLGNALYWAFSGAASVLLLCAVVFIWGTTTPADEIQFAFLFLVPLRFLRGFLVACVTMSWEATLPRCGEER